MQGTAGLGRGENVEMLSRAGPVKGYTVGGSVRVELGKVSGPRPMGKKGRRES